MKVTNHNIEPVFIIGCQRTGTTMLSSILNRYSDIDMLSELHLLEPFWLHKDFSRDVEKTVRDLEKDENIPKLIDLMYSKHLFGIFWDDISLDREIIRDRILDSDRSLKSIFQILMLEHCKASGKEKCGAKFPVHFSYIHKLLEWFPNCKIIHATRDIRGIYASQANKYLLKPGKTNSSDKLKNIRTGSIFQNYFMRFQMLTFISIQFAWAARVHSRSKHLNNYMLLRYEDIVLDPEPNVKRLCNFLGIDFKKEMLYPRVINSTFVKAYETEKGFNKEMVSKWKEHVSPMAANFLIALNKKAMSRFGYS